MNNRFLCFAIKITLITLLINNAVLGQTNNGFAVQTKVENGIIEGIYDTKTGLQLYLGVPFAKPPVGDLRWKAPQPLANWGGVKATKKFGPRAVQKVIYSDMIMRSDGVSEDCLYLNVWTPAKRNTTGLPVLVYFYGGGFSAGDGSEPRYDGASMAQKGIVVVTVNYRLNIFGFFVHPELSTEAPYKASGNYGLLDQNAALVWVSRNITSFGGDPKKITIAGESAGSISVSAQMASPLSKSLIAGAIGQSGATIHPTFAPIPLAEGEKIGREFVAFAGNLSIKQLRALSTREIYEMYDECKSTRFPIVIDGYFLPKQLTELFKAGEQAQVPLLLGWNSAEIPGMAFMQGIAYNEENYLKKVKDAYPDDFASVLEVYPYNSEDAIVRSATDLASDRFIAYSTWKWFDLHRKHSKQPVYRYLYSRIRPALVIKQNQSEGITDNAPKPIGAQHACEIEYCMGNLYLVTDYAWTKDDYKVSETMQNFFANFIKTGNPNSENLPEWPSVAPDDNNPPVMIIDTESKAIKAENDNRYILLDKIYKNN